MAGAKHVIFWDTDLVEAFHVVALILVSVPTEGVDTLALAAIGPLIAQDVGWVRNRVVRGATGEPETKVATQRRQKINTTLATVFASLSEVPQITYPSGHEPVIDLVPRAALAARTTTRTVLTYEGETYALR